MITCKVDFDEHRIYLNDWTIEIHFWDKCFRCAKTGFDTSWFNELEEAIKYCMEK